MTLLADYAGVRKIERRQENLNHAMRIAEKMGDPRECHVDGEIERITKIRSFIEELERTSCARETEMGKTCDVAIGGGMQAWQLSRADWLALSWEEQQAVCKRSFTDSPYIERGDSHFTQIHTAVFRGYDVPTEVMDSLGDWQTHLLAHHVILEYMWKTVIHPKVLDWSLDQLDNIHIVEFVPRERAKAAGGRLEQKFLAGLDELGWSKEEPRVSDCRLKATALDLY